MKKLYIALIFVTTTFISGVSAQSFQFVDPVTLTDITGDTVDVSGLPSDDPIEYFALVTNTGSSTKMVTMYRTYLDQPSGMTASFCWGITCYPSFVDTSTSPLVMAPGDTTTSFRGDGHPNFNVGIILARYCVYDENNPSDNACLTVRFLVGTSSVEETANGFTLSGVYPNPARDFINFNYEINSNASAEIRIYDLTGKKVKAIQLNANDDHLKTDISALTNGVYFYTLYLNGKSVLTKRLIISK